MHRVRFVWLLWACVSLLSATSAAALAEDDAGVCVSEGDPPERPPNVQLERCGPGALPMEVMVIVRVTTPEGTEEVQVGSCETRCDLVIVIDLDVCRAVWIFHPPVDYELNSPDDMWKTLSHPPESVHAESPVFNDLRRCTEHADSSLP